MTYVDAHVGAVEVVNPESSLNAVLPVHAVERYAAAQVEFADWTTCRTFTESVSVPAVWVATFSRRRTEPADVNVPPAPFWTEVL